MSNSESRSEVPVRQPRTIVRPGSRPIRVQEIDPKTGEWRERIKMSRKLLDDHLKGVFLQEYAKWGRIADAAAKIAVVPGLIKEEMKRDQEFAEAVLLAEEAYRDKLIRHHQNLVFHGTMKRTYGKDGSLVSEEQIFPIRLIELELKKHDAGYRDKQEVEMKVSGGVMIAPAEVASIDDWEKKFAQMKVISPSESEGS